MGKLSLRKWSSVFTVTIQAHLCPTLSCIILAVVLFCLIYNNACLPTFPETHLLISQASPAYDTLAHFGQCTINRMISYSASVKSFKMKKREGPSTTLTFCYNEKKSGNWYLNVPNTNISLNSHPHPWPKRPHQDKSACPLEPIH